VTIVVPLADPLRLDPDEAGAVRAAVAQVLDTGPLILGRHVEQFERSFADHLADGGREREVVGVGNGFDALAIVLTAFALPADAQVLVAANDGGFAAGAARSAGLVPVAVDADEVTQLVDLDLLQEAWTPQTRAVVVTHLHGQPVDLTGVLGWCRERGLVLVEDASQAHGATVAGQRVGMLGDAAAFSFYPTKNLGALGDAGAAVFADESVAERARGLRQYGWGERFRVELPEGRNSRLDAVQAAVLSARLPHLDENNARRRAIVGRYRAVLDGSGAVLLGDAPGAVAHHAVVVHPDRDRLVAVLGAHGITTSVHYPWLVTEMAGLGMAETRTPRAARGRDAKVSIPCFPTLTTDEVDRVVAALDEWVRSGG
jgi:dTDP-4-amino-4,6-dideoxygalactose transaminase